MIRKICDSTKHTDPLKAIMWTLREGEPMTGIERIEAERQRQINDKGWTPEHDDEHPLGELSQAAACYADIAGALMHGAKVGDIKDYYCDCTGPNPQWPFEDAAWKPSQDPVRNLAKAGALIAAEIDRLSRQNAIAMAAADERTPSKETTL